MSNQHQRRALELMNAIKHSYPLIEVTQGPCLTPNCSNLARLHSHCKECLTEELKALIKNSFVAQNFTLNVQILVDLEQHILRTAEALDSYEDSQQ